MPLKDVCQKDVITIQKNTKLKEAAKLMKDNHVGSLVVVESSNGSRIPCGIITDRDIALTLISPDKPESTEVGRIMHSHPILANEADGIFETTLKMRQFGVKRLPVINDKGTLCGIITLDDLLILMADELSALAKTSITQVEKEKGSFMPTKRSAKQTHA